MVKLTHASIARGGPYKGVSLKGVKPERIQQLYRFMLRLRTCEQALIKEYHPADEMRCPIHFCLGQEAVPAALAALLGPKDYLFSHHRSHGYFLAKGAPMRALFAELYGKATGANGGKAGSQDISMSSHRVYSGAILTGAVAIAVGAALGIRLQGTSEVAVAGFGEGATDEGVFWEAVNYATLHQLPIVFACENNCYATYSPQWKRQPADNISARVATFGMRTQTLFGNDSIAVHGAFEEAIDRARTGGGPTFVEAYTYRWNPHVGPESDDHIGYRPQAELQTWIANCPIALLEQALTKQGLWTSEVRAKLLAEINAEVDDAFQFAKSSPFPEDTSWHGMNYSTDSPLADQWLRDEEASEFDQNQAYTVPGPY